VNEDRSALIAALKRRLIWITAAGLVAGALAVGVLAATGPITVHLAMAAALGAFFTFLLGGGLFAVSFFSARGGYDEDAVNLDEGTERRN
jgi:hypothetical protein